MTNGQTFGPDFIKDVPGVGSAQFLLLDGVKADDKGVWVPWAPYHKGSYQLTSDTDMTGSVQLYGSNDLQIPANGYQITIGGSPAAGNIVGAQLSGPGFMNGSLEASYTVKAGDTTHLVAAGLAAAINSALSKGIMEYSSPIENFDSGVIFAASPSAAIITISWGAPLPPMVFTVDALGGGATVALAEYDDGNGFAIADMVQTAPGLLVFDMPCQWIKAALSGYDGTAAITAIVNAVFP